MADTPLATIQQNRIKKDGEEANYEDASSFKVPSTPTTDNEAVGKKYMEDTAGLPDSVQTLINKSIDADNNTITELELDNFKADVIDTDGTLASASDTELATQKATKTYVDTLRTYVVTNATLRADRGMIIPEIIDLDDTDTGIEQTLIGSKIAIGFEPDKDGAIWFDVSIPYTARSGIAFNLQLVYDMDTTEASKDVKFDLEYTVISNGGDTTPASITGTWTETWEVPSTEETLDIHRATGVIPLGYVEPGKMITIKLTRDTSVANNHTGNFRLLDIELYQL